MLNEIWLPIKIVDSKKSVSNYGRVRNTVTNGLLKTTFDKGGYERITLYVKSEKRQRSFKIHRLVAECFIPNPENKYTVNHKDSNKKNNYVENLEWCSTKENIAHYYQNKFVGVISNDDVLSIRKNEENLTPTMLGKKFGISWAYILAIMNGTYKPNIHKEFIRDKRACLPKPVIKMNKSGEIIAKFQSIYAAAKDANSRIGHIQRVLSGERKALKGYTYKSEGYAKSTDAGQLERLKIIKSKYGKQKK